MWGVRVFSAHLLRCWPGLQDKKKAASLPPFYADAGGDYFTLGSSSPAAYFWNMVSSEIGLILLAMPAQPKAS